MWKYSVIMMAMLLSSEATASEATESIGMVECAKAGELCTFLSEANGGMFALNMRVAVYATQNDDANIIGYVVRENTMGQLMFQPSASPKNTSDAQTIMLEQIGYEVYALPIIELSSDTQWLKIEQGWLAAEDLLIGTQTRYVSWLDKLNTQMESSAFSLTRTAFVKEMPSDGAKTLATIRVSDGWDLSEDGIGEFNMHDPEAIQGNWARVKLYHYCGGEDETPHAVGWIKLTNEKGQPNISSYPRGC